jgi:hypothetical protein
VAVATTTGAKAANELRCLQDVSGSPHHGGLPFVSNDAKQTEQ